MPNHLSILGIIHTAISILAILCALITLTRFGKISYANLSGRLYIWLTIVTCITGFPIMKTGHPTGGHYLGIIILVLLPIGLYAKQLRIFGKLADYVQVILLSMTLFLSFIPAVIETTTRLPIAHPLADGPNSPIVQNSLLALVLLFVAGVIYQIVKLKALQKSTQVPDNSIKLG